MSQPESRFYTSFGLRLHYVVWGDELNPPLVLVHGKGDHARSWDFFVDALIDRYAIYAPDLRGHGDSDWAAGGGYLIADYVTDLARLIRVIDRGPVDIVSHSLGGRIAPFYAAAFPEWVARLISIEGFGGFFAPGSTSDRLRAYTEDVARSESRQKRVYRTLDEAVERMTQEHPDFAPDLLRHLTQHAMRKLADGSLVWKFDEFVNLRPFYESRLEDSRDAWEAVRAPMMIVAGGQGWERMKPERRQFLTGLENARFEVVPGAGHWLHHSHPEAFLSLANDFLSGP